MFMNIHYANICRYILKNSSALNMLNVLVLYTIIINPVPIEYTSSFHAQKQILLSGKHGRSVEADFEDNIYDFKKPWEASFFQL